jgi:hypothetical protein
MNMTIDNPTNSRPPRALSFVRDNVRMRRRARPAHQALENENASQSYEAQVDAVLERIREENTFEASMIRSILGRNASPGNVRAS